MQTPIEFTFSERKAVEAVAHLLTLAGGKMERRKLLALLYLAERSSIKKYGHPIIGDQYRILKEDE